MTQIFYYETKYLCLELYVITQYFSLYSLAGDGSIEEVTPIDKTR